jgi:hypothetical protein
MTIGEKAIELLGPQPVTVGDLTSKISGYAVDPLLNAPQRPGALIGQYRQLPHGFL